ncbi:hypothetical protein F2P56_035664 [Juglans regia]|uniref:NDR1/HIN1-like protein 26 n=2 Tax=Juglans regia TaxID=51240 RepID=A0A2I4EPJ3_JUGRE|nr:NDR1/HIN1-like protein 26 [Juglans regia]KAF5443072.1 hypothetical protein F2P56_035664 [Juglans regia]
MYRQQRPESNPHFPGPHLPYDQNSQPQGKRTKIPHKLDPQDQEKRPLPRQNVQDQSSQPFGSPPLDLQNQDHRQTQPHGRQQQGDHSQGPRIPRDRRTNPLTWLGAVFCAILWVVIIVGGLIVLIIYLVFRPRSPGFDISSVTLNAAYLDMGHLLNADVTLLVNFTNPNKKVRIDYSYMYINLYYETTLISTQYIEPFSAAKAESKFAYIHMVTSQVRLPKAESLRLQKQIESNGIMLQVKGIFRARSNLGSILRYSYWLHGECTILTAGPPDGVLIKRKCKTKH